MKFNKLSVCVTLVKLSQQGRNQRNFSGQDV